jgi:hypothetical protein
MTSPQVSPGFQRMFAQNQLTVGVFFPIGLNLKYGERPAAEVLEEIGQEVLPVIQSTITSGGVYATH